MKTAVIALPALLLLLLSGWISALPAQPQWRLSGEGGWYSDQPDLPPSRLNFLSRFSGLLRYRQTQGKNIFAISLQLKPEFYSDQVSQSAVKIMSRGQFDRRHSRTAWGVAYDLRRYHYSAAGEDLTLDIFELQGNVSWFFSRHYSLVVYPAYYYRDLTNLTRQKLDALTTQLDLLRIFSPQLQAGIGVHLERFNLQGIQYQLVIPLRLRESGWRLGPKFLAELRGKFFLTLNYFLLWSGTNTTTAAANEHFIRLFWGKMLHRQWTALFLVDFYWNYNTPAASETESVLYIPFDNENRVDFKLERLMNQQLVYFLKIGYFKNVLISRQFTFQGWQALLGIEYSQ